MTTGEIIQRERTRLGLSQEKLAEQVGVSRQAVSKWELGGRSTRHRQAGPFGAECS